MLINRNKLNLEMAVALISILLLALAVVGLAIKILVKKDGKFAGTCSSNNAFLQKEGGACSICGAKPAEQCQSKGSSFIEPLKPSDI
jgi:hypothetical protein